LNGSAAPAVIEPGIASAGGDFAEQPGREQDQAEHEQPDREDPGNADPGQDSDDRRQPIRSVGMAGDPFGLAGEPIQGDSIHRMAAVEEMDSEGVLVEEDADGDVVGGTGGAAGSSDAQGTAV
jgi:hypothetical protein